MSAAAFGAIARQSKDRHDFIGVFVALKQMQQEMDELFYATSKGE